MRIHYKPDPDREYWIAIDLPIPKDVLRTLDPDRITEFVTAELAKRYAKVRNYNLDDPRVLSYQQGQYDWVKGYVVEHVISVFERAEKEALG